MGENRTPLFYGYLLGAGVPISAGGRSLEDVATPLALRRPGTRAEGAARSGL